MYFVLTTLCIFNVITVHSSPFFGITNGYRHLYQEFLSNTLLAAADVNSQWVEQKLDNFDTNESRTWKMKYFERLDYYKPNGPVYLYIGGESPATPAFLQSGLVNDLAAETNGAMFMSEHRYYGDSQPVQRSNIEDMKYLSTPQALADNANLLRIIKNKNDFKDSKVVVIGGSYAGNLAAWMRLVYPDLVDAAISSSGPVLAQRDFYEYLEVVSTDYEHYGSADCLEKIQNIFQRYNSLLQTEDGIKKLKEEESICEFTDMSNSDNQGVFFSTKATPFMSTAQYGDPFTIKNHCDTLHDTQNKPGQTYNEKYYWNEKNTCYDYDFNRMIELYKEKDNDWIYCWIYQTCTEFGYFQSTTSDNQPFTKNIPVESYDKTCTSLFGPEFGKDKVNQGVTNINNMYGGRTPNVTKVVFSNGELDPWSALSVLKDITPDAPAVFIPKSSHCKDLYSSTETDPQEMIDARARIKSFIKEWIGANNEL